MLNVQLKETEHIDFSLLNSHIENTYGEDPSKFSHAIAQLNQLRVDVQGVSTNATGRDILYKYYGQLELLELHFPLAQLGFHFTWLDAFNREPTVQTSQAFEKASVIFNIGALISNMAATANRSEESGIKTACNYFECAAGVFQYVSDNFLHAPSVDMGKDFITVLVNVMLAQAQECFVDKVIMEKKKSAMIMKLAAQASSLYQTASDLIGNTDSLKNYCPPLWVNTVKIKAKYYNSLAQYHRALIAETEGKYGEWVGRIQYAETLAKENLKLAKDLSGMAGISQLIGSWGSSAAKKDSSATVLQDAIKNYHAFLSQRATQAAKDNDVIYHDNVPVSANLPPLDKLSVTAAKKLTDVFPHLPSVIGENMFSALVPMEVHEKSSIYSEEKAQLVRKEVERVGEADGEMSARIASMNLPESLDRLKRVYKQLQGQQVQVELPKAVSEWTEFVQSSENRETLSGLLGKLESIRNASSVNVNEAVALIEQDNQQWNDLKAQYGDMWSQSGPETAAQPIRKDIEMQRKNLDAGQNGDQQLMAKYNACKADLDILAGSIAAIEALYKSPGAPQTQSASLLDIPVETISAKDLDLMKKVDDMLQNVYQLKKDRVKVLNELKEKVKNEDISQLLVLNKKNEENVFKVEMEKFDVYKNKIISNVNTQIKNLEDLSNAQAALLQSDLAKSAERRVQSSSKVTKRLRDARASYEEIRTNAQQGVRYYETLLKGTLELKTRAQELLQKRQNERRDLISRVGSNQTDLLQKKLSALNMNTGLPSPSYAPSQPSPHYNQQMAPPLSQGANIPYQAPPSYATYTPPQAHPGMNMPPMQMNRAPYNYQPVAPSVHQKTELTPLPSHLNQPLSGLGSAPQPLQQPQYQPPPQFYGGPPPQGMSGGYQQGPPLNYQQPPMQYGYPPNMGYNPHMQPPAGAPMQPYGAPPPQQGIPPKKNLLE